MDTKKELNLLGIIFASIFAIAFFFTLIFGVFFNSGINMIKPEKIIEIVSNNKELFSEKNTVAVEFVEKSLNISDEKAKVFLSDPISRDIISEIAVVSVKKAMNGEIENTSDEIGKHIAQNAEKYAEVLLKTFPERLEGKTNEYVAEKLREFSDTDKFNQYVQKYSDVVVQKLNSNQQFKKMMNVFTNNLTVLIELAFCLIFVFMYGAIFALRFPNFKGFVWNGITLVSAAVVSLAISIFINMIDFSEFAGIGTVISGDFTDCVIIRSVIMLFIGGISIALYFVINKIRNKKKNNNLIETTK